MMKLNPLFALAAVAALGLAGCDQKKADDAKTMIEDKGAEAKDAATTKIDEAKEAAKEKAPAVVAKQITTTAVAPAAAGTIDKAADDEKDATVKAVEAVKAAAKDAAAPKTP